jgi:hypothetical protein
MSNYVVFAIWLSNKNIKIIFVLKMQNNLLIISLSIINFIPIGKIEISKFYHKIELKIIWQLFLIACAKFTISNHDMDLSSVLQLELEVSSY